MMMKFAAILAVVFPVAGGVRDVLRDGNRLSKTFDSLLIYRMHRDDIFATS